jgi:hypothetical protein
VKRCQRSVRASYLIDELLGFIFGVIACEARLLVACMSETDLGHYFWHGIVVWAFEHQSDRNPDDIFVADDEAHLVVLQDVAILVAKNTFEALVQRVEDDLHVGQQDLAQDVAMYRAVVQIECRRFGVAHDAGFQVMLDDIFEG